MSAIESKDEAEVLLSTHNLVMSLQVFFKGSIVIQPPESRARKQQKISFLLAEIVQMSYGFFTVRRIVASVPTV